MALALGCLFGKWPWPWGACWGECLEGLEGFGEFGGFGGFGAFAGWQTAALKAHRKPLLALALGCLFGKWPWPWGACWGRCLEGLEGFGGFGGFGRFWKVWSVCGRGKRQL